MNHISTIKLPSKAYPGVFYSIRKMSFGRRLEMMRLVRDLAKRLEFHAAGTNAADESEQGILTSEINTLYLTWGLVEIDGLEIDGRPASTACMIEDGPETLCHEIIASVKSECFLSEDERKN